MFGERVMGLDAAVYADDEEDRRIASIRIGNLDAIVHLRESIKAVYPDANVLLTKVLYSAFHAGDRLEKTDLTTVRDELSRLSECRPNDAYLKEFIVAFGGLVTTGLKQGRPITFI
jgi:hypothetical protein